jgi:uncharacterized protein (DUF427 family)
MADEKRPGSRDVPIQKLPRWALDRRKHWKHIGAKRPAFALETLPGQESVWDYPRPPRLDPDSREVVVRLGESIIAKTTEAIRVLETAGPPTFYLPGKSVQWQHLAKASGSSQCEWKGVAAYWDVVLGTTRLDRVGWSYPEPFPGFGAIRDYLSFYPGRLECYVGGERVEPQPGGFYGGWVTSEVVGPFKGVPGSESW